MGHELTEERRENRSYEHFNTQQSQNEYLKD